MQVDRECNLRAQSVVMGVTITKLVVFQSLDLTNLSTSKEYSSTRTLRRNDHFQFCTRTRQCGSKNTFNTINVDTCSGVTLTRISQSNISNSARSDLIINLNGDLNKTTFTITQDRNLSIDTRCIFSTTIIDSDFLDLTIRCNIRYNRKFLIESTRRDQFNRVDRTDCLDRSGRVRRVRTIKLIFTNFCIGEFRFVEKFESKLSVRDDFADSKLTIKRSLNHIDEGVVTNRRIGTQS